MTITSNDNLDNSLEEMEKVNKILDLYHLARDKKRYAYDLWRRNYMLVHSRMWNTFPTTWQPTPTDNEMYPVLSRVVSWMTDQEVDFTVNPEFEQNTPQYLHADQLSRNLEVCLRANWHAYNWQLQIKLAIWDSTIYGTGILKSQWDSSLERGLGNVNMVRIDPWTFYPDPNCTSFDDATYVIEVKKISYDELERKFPEHYHLLKRGGYDTTGEADVDAKPSIVNTSTFPLANPGAISPAKSNSYGLPGQSRRSAVIEPGVYLYECWYQENEEQVTDKPVHGDDKETNETEEAPVVFCRWRVAIMCEGTILLDEYAEDLYGVDRHPYSRFVFEDLGEFWGVALATHIAPCQVAINRLLSALQQNTELTGNPIFIEPSTAGISRTSIINRPGTRLPYSTQNTGGAKPDWLQPPQMPPAAMQLIEFWISRMENICGITDINKGKEPAPRTAAKQSHMAQDAAFTRIRSAQNNLEATLKDAGFLLATLVVQNYTTPRIVSLTGDKENGALLKVTASHFSLPTQEGNLPLRFSIAVDAGSDQPTSRQSRISEADTLAAMGMIDQEAVLTAHRFPGAGDILRRMTEAKQAAIAAGIQTDGGPGARVRAKRTS